MASFNDQFISQSLLSPMVKEYWQETQLSLTNRVTRLEVSQGHHAWYHSVC